MIEETDGFSFLKPGMVYYFPSSREYLFKHHINRDSIEISHDARISLKGEDAKDDLFNRLVRDYEDSNSNWGFYERDLAVSFFKKDLWESISHAHKLIDESQSWWGRFRRNQTSDYLLSSAGTLSKRANFDYRWIIQIANQIDLMPGELDEMESNLGLLGGRLEISMEFKGPRRAREIWKQLKKYNDGINDNDFFACYYARNKLIEMNAAPYTHRKSH